MMRIDTFDVGHGGCSVITCPNGARIMLDCGFRTDPPWFPSIEFRGTRFDLLVFTNLDEDHVRDLPFIWTHVPIGAVFSNPSLTSDALAAIKREHGMGRGVAFAHAILEHHGTGLIGHLGDLGGVRIWAYWNSFGFDFVDTNNLSLAVFVRLLHDLVRWRLGRARMEGAAAPARVFGRSCLSGRLRCFSPRA